MSYKYPDPQDHLTAAMIERLEPHPGYWAASERRILERMREAIGNRKRILLDAGCGEGRLFPVFADLFEEIVALEPDPIRLAVAQATVERLGLTGKVTLTGIDAASYERAESSDVCLCSHIIQHIHTDSVAPLIAALARTLAPDGLLLLTTNNSSSEDDAYAKDISQDGHVLEVPITQMEFNALVTNDPGVLPIHSYSRAHLEALLAEHSLIVDEVACFHCFGDFGELESVVSRDVIVNAVPELRQRYGRDIYVRAHKQ